LEETGPGSQGRQRPARTLQSAVLGSAQAANQRARAVSARSGDLEQADRTTPGAGNSQGSRQGTADTSLVGRFRLGRRLCRVDLGQLGVDSFSASDAEESLDAETLRDDSELYLCGFGRGANCRGLPPEAGIRRDPESGKPSPSRSTQKLTAGNPAHPLPSPQDRRYDRHATVVHPRSCGGLPLERSVGNVRPAR
jgi:hypothetical protein